MLTDMDERERARGTVGAAWPPFGLGPLGGAPACGPLGGAAAGGALGLCLAVCAGLALAALVSRRRSEDARLALASGPAGAIVGLVVLGPALFLAGALAGACAGAAAGLVLAPAADGR